MAIAFDAATDGGLDNPTLTFAHTCSGSDRLLYVGVKGDPSTDEVTGVTYDGVSMTLVDKIAPGNRWAYLFQLENPASGTNNVVVSSTSLILAGAVSYTGAVQTGQPNASDAQLDNTAPSSSGLTLQATSTVDNCWGVGIIGGFAGSLPPTAVQGTRRTFDATFGTWGIFDTDGPVTPAGAVTLEAVYIAGNTEINGVLAAFAPAGGGGGGNPWYAYAQQ